MSEIIFFSATYIIYIAVTYTLIFPFLHRPKGKQLRFLLITFGTALLVWGMGLIVKEIIRHPRPDLLQSLFIPNDEYSFPSGHATFMFALAFAVSGFTIRAGEVLVVLAAITGVARVLAGVHYWYDIVGAIILCAFAVPAVFFVLKKVSKYFSR